MYEDMNQKVIAQFRAGGEIEGMHRDRLVLLTTAGRKSGKSHTTPMMFHRDGDRVLVIASAAGAPRHPAWYHNLLANPTVTVEIGDERYQATATPITGPAHEPVWAMITELYPFFANHQAKIDRTIPVVALERVE